MLRDSVSLWVEGGHNEIDHVNYGYESVFNKSKLKQIY